jgi:phage shock protein A
MNGSNSASIGTNKAEPQGVVGERVEVQRTCLEQLHERIDSLERRVRCAVRAGADLPANPFKTPQAPATVSNSPRAAESPVSGLADAIEYRNDLVRQACNRLARLEEQIDL